MLLRQSNLRKKTEHVCIVIKNTRHLLHRLTAYSICHAWAAFAGISPSFPEPKASWWNVKQVPCHWLGSKKTPTHTGARTWLTAHHILSASCVFCWFSIKQFLGDTEKKMHTITAKIIQKNNTMSDHTHANVSFAVVFLLSHLTYCILSLFRSFLQTYCDLQFYYWQLEVKNMKMMPRTHIR